MKKLKKEKILIFKELKILDLILIKSIESGMIIEISLNHMLNLQKGIIESITLTRTQWS